MKAVIYARYSSDNQTEASIEGQLRECMQFQKHSVRRCFAITPVGYESLMVHQGLVKPLVLFYRFVLCGSLRAFVY